MPPKARFTKEMIIDAAYDLAKEQGMEAVAAREVAKRLNMTVTPIFGSFTNMAELKQRVYDRARREFLSFLRGALDTAPAYREFALRWIQYAGENPNFYRMLMTQEGTEQEPLTELIRELLPPLTREITDTFALSQEKAKEILEYLVIYANGIASFRLRGTEPLPQPEIARGVTRLCTALAAQE